jgi:GTPase SAR1 family protein
LSGNKLTELPTELGNLTKLTELLLDGNLWISPPHEIIFQGAKAVLTYLWEQIKARRQQWESKLLVVGEGGVGKTSLLRRLKGEEYKEGMETTHGVCIEKVEVAHPEEKDVVMTLNAWDFGGQEIYHATHQFFLTNRSLFILCWNARHGYEQGKLYYWLDTISARAPESPVLIVAAWIDERDADLPLAELKKKYPQIVGHHEISNKTGQGIDDLRKVIALTAAQLPLMGQNWPANWLYAAEALRAMEEKYINPHELGEIMEIHNVLSESDKKILTTWLHELGDILFFQDDEEMDDIVILKPQWVTNYICEVLESDDVISKLGIFTRDHMRQLWGDLDHGMQDHFLRLMEKFDLSYRTLENREISLVVERLPLDPPAYETKWNTLREGSPIREISMKFRLNTLPAGIPTWFIARSHRFTTHTHWRRGALFADAQGQRHLALAQAFAHDRCLQLTVRGPHPQNFFALLKDGIEVTLGRFPGLKIDRTIPCPGHNGESCPHEFHYTHLQTAIEKAPPVLEIQCPASFEMVSVPKLLFGLHWRMQDAVLNRIDKLETTVVGKQENILEELKELKKLTQREFTNLFRREQANIDSHCPNVFVLRPVRASGWKKALVGQEVELHLYCQAPGCWHPTTEGGSYIIVQPAEWIASVSPYLQKMVAVLKYAVPLAGPWVGMAFPKYKSMFENDLEMMKELVSKLPDLKEHADMVLSKRIGEIPEPGRVEGAALRALRRMLEEKDRDRVWGGLKKVLTPEGHCLWLCREHAKEYEI